MKFRTISFFCAVVAVCSFTHTAHASTVSYQYIKWDITEKKGVEDCIGSACVQASDFGLMLGADPVDWPNGTTVDNPNGANPAGQEASKLADNDVNTKWVDTNFNNDSTQTTGESTVVFQPGEQVEFSGYYFKTGDDYPERDPISWTVSGSNDGFNWTVLDTQTNESITDNRQDSTIGYVISLGNTTLDGEGTEDDPYLIYTCADFETINDDLSSYYQLQNDIDCTNEGNDIVIQDLGSGFSGTFDGQGHTMTYALDASFQDYVGLFMSVNGGTIKDLAVSEDTTVTGHDVVGSIVGIMQGGGQLIRVTSAADVVGINPDGFDDAPTMGVGGLVGLLSNGSVFGSSFTGQVLGVAVVGGLVGQVFINGVISRSWNTASVTGLAYVGGITGGMFQSSIRNSYNIGTVSIPIEAQDEFGDDVGFSGAAGGLVGTMQDALISRSYFAGEMHIDNQENNTYTSAGLVGVGYGEATIEHSFSVVPDQMYQIIGDHDSDLLLTNDWFDVSVTPDGVCTTAPISGCFPVSGGGDYWTDRTHEPLDRYNTTVVWTIDDANSIPFPVLQTYISSAGEDEEDEDDGDDEPEDGVGPLETILTTNNFTDGGVAQGWNSDDEKWDYALPFSFQFYGGSYEHAYISSNGYLGFVNDSHLTETTFDVNEGFDGVPVISALALDLRTDINPGDDIYVTDTGDGSVHFRWQGTPYDDDTITLSFEIVLHSDGTFEINYGPFSGVLPGQARVGINSGNGHHVNSVYDNDSDFSNHLTSSWAPPAPPVEEEPEEEHHRNRHGSSAVTSGPVQVPVKNAPPVVSPPVTTPVSTIPVIDLTIGMTGDAVSSLQTFLISKATGPAATALSTFGPTGYFGIYTKNALAEFQQAHGIQPAVGYFGPITRAYIASKP